MSNNVLSSKSQLFQKLVVWKGTAVSFKTLCVGISGPVKAEVGSGAVQLATKLLPAGAHTLSNVPVIYVCAPLDIVN